MLFCGFPLERKSWQAHPTNVAHKQRGALPQCPDVRPRTWKPWVDTFTSENQQQKFYALPAPQGRRLQGGYPFLQSIPTYGIPATFISKQLS